MIYGLALSGGSLRGATHIGILEVLDEAGLPPHAIAGTSAGSIIGSLYAAGVQPKKLGQIFSQLLPKAPKPQEYVIKPLMADPMTTKTISWLPLPKGLLKADFIESFIEKMIGRLTFEELTLPLAVVTADLHTGEAVIFTAQQHIPPKPWPPNTVYQSGVPVAEAVMASSIIPGIFTPKTIGNRTLVDGGLVSNVPADVVKIFGAQKIIAVDLGFGVYEAEPLKNVIDILLQTYDIMGQRVSNLILEQHAHFVLRPQTGGAGLLDFHKIPGFINKGRIVARENLNAIKQIVCT
ncbi:MAG: patatin-like phospholipase family protein [Clostridia bacterium]|nr:patatin-like phospholipase family protein [Clostridia bacterium]